jgi:hypothetical protein
MKIYIITGTNLYKNWTKRISKCLHMLILWFITSPVEKQIIHKINLRKELVKITLSLMIKKIR